MDVDMDHGMEHTLDSGMENVMDNGMDSVMDNGLDNGMDSGMNNLDVIIDDEPLPLEREDRPRSRTWPILPPPCETIHEHERDAEIAEPPTIIEEVELEEDANGETPKPGTEANPRKNSRKNAWGNLSYADLITQAIQTAPEQRLTLSQIYEWMVRNIAYFKDKGDSTSSAGWKNSIRHNLSLHNRFMRVQNDSNGKSSYWVINADAKPGKSSRRRSGSVDGQPKGEKKRMKNKKMHQSTDDISALSPNSIKFKAGNHSYENLLSATSPCSSTDSLANLDEFHSELNTPYAGDNFNRPRSTSNVSQQSSVSGRMTPIHGDIDADLLRLEEQQLRVGGVESVVTNEAVNMVQEMRIDNHYQTNINNNITINLNDSLKLVKTEQTKMLINCQSNDPMLQPRRAHSNSFGSADSGYDSPAACFPPEFNGTQNIMTNRVQMSQNTPASNGVPNGVPNKPPPPYQGGFPPSLRHQQQPGAPGMFGNPGDMGPGNFFPGPGGLGGPVRSNPSAPRLKHLPLTTYPPQQQQQQQQQFNGPQPQMNRSFSMQVQNTTAVYECNSGPFGNGEMKIKQEFESKTINSALNNNNSNNNNNNNGWDNADIPSDLHQVKLFDFQDQQQLASDLDAIIKNDLNSSTSLQSICDPFHMNTGGVKPYSRDLNNNKNLVGANQYMQNMLPTHDWVR